MKEYEKIIKQRLSSAEHAYPTDLWSKISADMDQQKDRKKPIFAWVILSSLLSICVIGVGLLLYTSTHNTNNNKDRINTVAVHAEAPLSDSSTGGESLSSSLVLDIVNSVSSFVVSEATTSTGKTDSESSISNSIVVKSSSSNQSKNVIAATRNQNTQNSNSIDNKASVNYTRSANSSQSHLDGIPVLVITEDEILEDFPMLSWIEDKGQKNQVEARRRKSYRTHTVRLPKSRTKSDIITPLKKDVLLVPANKNIESNIIELILKEQ